MKLSDNIENFFNLDARKKRGLKKLNIKTIEDLLRHFPSRYMEIRKLSAGDYQKFKKGDIVSLCGIILDIKIKKPNFYAGKKMPIIEADFDIGNGTIKAVWFNQPYIAKMINKGDKCVFTGKIYENKKAVYLSNPKFEHRDNYFQNGAERREKEENGEEAAPLIPVYPETRGITSKWLQMSAAKVLNSLPQDGVPDFIPDAILKKYNLPPLRRALIYIHLPKTLKHSEVAKKRFAFEEIFLIQIERQKQKMERNGKPSFEIKVDYGALAKFVSSFGFELTNAQRKAVFRICEDFKKGTPMARLLEGDVGSGKTIAALTACFAVVQNNLQAAYMAPTEILARQHFETFCKIFKNGGIKVNIGFLTSSSKEKFPSKVNPGLTAKISKNKLLKWIENGEIDILIGTHSLIQDKIKFNNLAFVVIDEQHRFGVNQRLKLVSKSEKIPHLLSMTATPIPRTLALTIYGDLDLTLLNEMPPGRKQAATYIVPPEEKHRAYEHIKEEIKSGRQAYIVCPRIEAEQTEAEGIEAEGTEDGTFSAEKSEMKAVKKEYEILSETVFKDFNLGILHGKLLPKEKKRTLLDFRDKKIDILIATSVIEVGIDIPNVNCILIEGADRFGLAQLHQLRGRTLRSSYRAHCFVASGKNSIKILKRLSALTKAKNGFELSEYDLKFRGPGELAGRKQWGISDMGMEALKNIKMVEAARNEAQKILKNDFNLSKTPSLKEKVKKIKNAIHLE